MLDGDVLEVAFPQRSTGSGKYSKNKGSVHECEICSGNPIDERRCREFSRVSRNNKKCVEVNCDSPWRVCRACVLQGAAKFGRKVKDDGLCEFHLQHGEDADIVAAEVASAETDRVAAKMAKRDMEAGTAGGAEKIQKIGETEAKPSTFVPGAKKAKKVNGAETETSIPVSRVEEAETADVAKAIMPVEVNEAVIKPILWDITAGGIGEIEAKPKVPDPGAEEVKKTKDNISPEDGLRKVISPILDGNVPNLLVSDLFPDPDQPRQTFCEEDLEDLGKSILEHGQMLPVIVLREGERFRIIDGERRWRACQKMSIRNIYAIVVKSLKIDRFLISAICNFGREEHTPLEKSRAVSRAISIIEEMAGRSGEELNRTAVINKVADGFCKTTVWVYQYLSVSRLDPEIQKLIGKWELPVSVAFDLAQVKSRQAQSELVGKIIGNGMSAKSARQLVRGKIEEEGGKTRKEKRNPKDDYRILRTFVYNTLDGLTIILGWGSPKIIGLFFNRDGKDRIKILEYLDKIIAKLQKLRETVHNDGSIRDTVSDSVKRLWEADEPDK